MTVAYSYPREEKPDEHPWRTLAVCEGTGIFFFVAMLFAILTLIGWATSNPAMASEMGVDSSALNFYWIFIGLGALWGFERFWTTEYGPSNPWYQR